jgi:hypothetical protein
MDGLRAVGRFAVFALMGIAVLAAYGFADLERVLAGRPGLRRAAQSFLIGGLLVETFGAPLPTAAVPAGRQIPEVYQWLAREPGEFAIAEVPMGVLWDDVRCQYYSTAHWKRLVNGYSAFTPPDYAATAAAINQFPADAAIETLRTVGCRLLIFHAAKMNRPAPETSGTATRLVRRFGDDVVYEVLR